MTSNAHGSTLSEAASKEILRTFGVPFAHESVTHTADEAVAAAEAMGFPVVVKLGGDSIAHKTERGLVRLRLADAAQVRVAASELLSKATPEDGEVHLLVAEMVSGGRELIAGVLVDPQFGPTVMLGIGGVLAEAIADVTFRPAPVSREQAADMIDSLRTQKFLGPFRGDAAVDRDQLVDCLLALSQVAVSRADITSIDINPLIVTSNGRIVAVDALVELGERGRLDSTSRRFTAEQFRALFDPKGVLVTGASTHPGKFGFVSLHNILASGYEGAVYGTNLSGEEVLGVKTVADIDALPDNAIDLVFVCTPAEIGRAHV